MNLWGASVELMLLGMGSVFVFLVLLVISTTIMSSVVAKMSDEQPLELDSSEADVAAVAAVALMRHEKTNTL